MRPTYIRGAFDRRALAKGSAILGLAAAVLLGSCSSQDRLPPDARDRLMDATAALPGSAAPAEVVRAWRGEGIDPPQTREIWCVEVDQTLIPDGGADSIRTVWIVVREGPDSEWQAAMLMTLSAWWPYEACGVAP